MAVFEMRLWLLPALQTAFAVERLSL